MSWTTNVIPYRVRRLGRYYDQIKKSIPISDLDYARSRFISKFGYPLDIENPVTFSQKLQWIKLYYRKPLLTSLADKYKVRNYIANKVGQKYLIHLYGVYKRADEIDFNDIPNQFVLKANHGSGWNVICYDKKNLDIFECRQKLNGWLKLNYYKESREWCYKNIRPRIVCEEFIGSKLLDYKFMCFNGKSKCIKVDIDRFTDHRRNIYNNNWELLPAMIGFKNSPKIIPKPENFDEMRYIAETLAEEFPFVRVDLYSTNQKVYFGEMTFYPGNGFSMITPTEYDIDLGSYLKLT